MLRIRSLFLVLFSVVLFSAACGGDDTSEEGVVAADDGADESSDDDSGSGDDASGDDGTDVGSAGNDGSDDDADPADDGTEAPDDDDAADIIGQPDLDTEDLPDEVADALDEIDDVVSIGECASEVVGLAVTAPDEYQCRVLDQAIGGLDGFTVFKNGYQLEITIGTPSPLGGPCDIPGLCDEAEPIDLSSNFPDTQIAVVAGVPVLWGNHATVDAELVITHLQPLSDDDLAVIRAVLDSAVEI